MKAGVTISRCSNDKVYLSIEDSTSHQKFVEVALSLEDFALLITGRSGVEGDVKYTGLQNVGKVKVLEYRSAICPLKQATRLELLDWLHNNCVESGWTIAALLNSQGSIKHVESGTQLNYSVYKYVERT